MVTWWRRNRFENSMIGALLQCDHMPYREFGEQTVDYVLNRAGIDHTADEVAAGVPYDILFVANHTFDCTGAKAAGMRTAFINRRRRPFGNTRYAPDAEVDDFAHLATIITSAHKGR